MDMRTGVAAPVGRDAAPLIVVVPRDLATFDYRRNLPVSTTFVPGQTAAATLLPPGSDCPGAVSAESPRAWEQASGAGGDRPHPESLLREQL